MTAARSEKRKGFVLLYAMLISSIVLSVGMGIFNVTLKQLLLSLTVRESYKAFYAADSAAECLFYWDARWYRWTNEDGTGLNRSPFATSTANFSDPIDFPPPGLVRCNGADIVVSGNWPHEADQNSGTTTFEILLSQDRFPAHASVDVAKNEPINYKHFDVRGHNMQNVSNPSAVERTIRGRFD